MIPMERYYQPEIECASQEQLRAWQDERLMKQVRNVWDNVSYYRKKMEEKGLTPDDIQGVADLHKLPFVTKADLREAYPYGLLARSLKDCVRIHSTSGTTGKRVVAFYTQHDVDLWEDCCARALVAAGATNEDVCQVSYGYGLFTGGAGLHGGSHKAGCLTIPASSGNTERQIMFIKDLNATILCCTPSYAAYLGESMKEMGMTPDQIPLKAGIFGAEAWSEEMRQDIQNTLGIKAYDIYGLTELSGPGVAFECSAQSGMHINEDHFIAEIIDPDTGEVLPEGSKGELVFTSITKEAFPLLRYRTRDICMLLRPHPCEDVQAHGPLRRYAHHPGGQRVPLSDRDGAAQPRLSRQLSDHCGPGEVHRHPGRPGGDDPRDVHRQPGRDRPPAEGAGGRPAFHAGSGGKGHSGGAQVHCPQ
jgi:phenylacetate-CoA ligase